MVVIVVGLNHRTVPVGTMERFTFATERLPKALHDLGQRPHLNEAVLVSTCMRTELYVVAERFHPALESLRDFLCDQAFLAPEDFADHLYTYYDSAATKHLFTVAAGLDSAVLGEGEVLGQVKRAADAAQEAGTIGPVLSAMFRHATETGKRARSETAIARGVTSVSQAAVEMARLHLGGIAGRTALVIGAGETGAGMATTLGRFDVDVYVLNRTWRKAVELANRVDGTPIDLADLGDTLTTVDMVLCSTSTEEAVIRPDELEEVMAARDGRPLLLVDVAVPRDVDPACRDLNGVTVFDMDDLKAFVQRGHDERRGEVDHVAAIVAVEVERHTATLAQRRMAPLVSSLRARAEEIRQSEVDRLAGRLTGLLPREREAVEALTKGIVAKLLHEPTIQLKTAASTGDRSQLAAGVALLFGLPERIEDLPPAGQSDPSLT